jgi:hypothetical protein
MICVQINAAKFLSLAQNKLIDSLMRLAQNVVTSTCVARDVDGLKSVIDRFGFCGPQLFAQLKANTNSIRTDNKSVAKWNSLLKQKSENKY